MTRELEGGDRESICRGRSLLGVVGLEGTETHAQATPTRRPQWRPSGGRRKPAVSQRLGHCSPASSRSQTSLSMAREHGKGDRVQVCRERFLSGWAVVSGDESGNVLCVKPGPRWCGRPNVWTEMEDEGRRHGRIAASLPELGERMLHCSKSAWKHSCLNKAHRFRPRLRIHFISGPCSSGLHSSQKYSNRRSALTKIVPQSPYRLVPPRLPRSQRMVHAARHCTRRIVSSSCPYLGSRQRDC